MEFAGCLVLLDCGAFGTFQGKVVSVDAVKLTITLSNALKNGEPTNQKVVLNSAEIQDLKVLEMNEPKKQSKTVGVNGMKKNDRKETKEMKNKETPGANKKPPTPTPSAAGGKGKEKKAPNQPKEKKDANEPKIEKEKKQKQPEVSKHPDQKVPPSEKKGKKQKRESPVPANNPVLQLIAAVESQKPASGVDGVRIQTHDLFAKLSVDDVSNFSQSDSMHPRPYSGPESNFASSDANQSKFSSSDFRKFGEYKSFKPQKPMPCKLAGTGSNKRRGPYASPSGIPLMDFSNGYGPVHPKNRDLEEKLDENLLQSDFDFEGNGALFDRASEGGSEDEKSEPHANIRNFRNDENIIQDPSRCTSWVADENKTISHLRMRNCQDFELPVLSTEAKETLSNMLIKHMGANSYYHSVSIHLLNFILHVMKESKQDRKNVVVLGAPTVNSVLVSSLATGLTNRNFNVTLVNCDERIQLENVNCVQVVKGITNVQVIIVLDHATIQQVSLTWLPQVANGRHPAHVFGLDHVYGDVAHSHTLYLGAFTDSADSKKPRKHSIAVADIGAPYSVFQDDARDSLAKAFAFDMIRYF